MTLEIDVLTLFPAMIEGPLGLSIPGRIQDDGLVTIRVHDLREFGLGRHRVGRRHAVRRRRRHGHARRARSSPPSNRSAARTRWSSCRTRPARSSATPGRSTWPGGRIWSSSVRATRASTSGSASFVDLELSIGDYVLTGGELPALVVVDAVIRLLPGAIDAASTDEESFSAGLLEYPQYTRPPSFRGMDVPRHPDLRRPRRGRALAPRTGGRADACPPTGPAAADGRGLSSTRPARTSCYTPASSRLTAASHMIRPRSFGCPHDQGTAA